MFEKMKPLPCPNPECSTENPRVHFTILSGYEVYFIECQNDKCCHHGPPKHDEQEAITAWNSLPRVLTWTKEPPKVIGWYFWRSETVQGVGYETTIYIADVPEFLEHLKACTHENVMFAGPIPMPKEPSNV